MISSLRIAAQNKDLKEDIRRLGLTFAIALITGWTFLQLGIPAPFLIGSLLGVWIFGRLFKTFPQSFGRGPVVSCSCHFRSWCADWCKFHKRSFYPIEPMEPYGQRHDRNDHSGINHRIPVFCAEYITLNRGLPFSAASLEARPRPSLWLVIQSKKITW